MEDIDNSVKIQSQPITYNFETALEESRNEEITWYGWVVIYGTLVTVTLLILLILKKMLVDDDTERLPVPKTTTKVVEEICKSHPPRKDICLVIGGGGFVGRNHIVNLSKNSNYSIIRVVDAFQSWSPKDEGLLNVEFTTGDVRNVDDMITAVRGVGTVFHLVALVDLRDGPLHTKRMWDVNYVGTMNVVNACISCGVENLVYLSSCGTVIQKHPLEMVSEDMDLPAPATLYGETKLAAEQAVLGANGVGNLKTVALRPMVIFGPYDMLVTERIYGKRNTIPDPKLLHNEDYAPSTIIYVESLSNVMMKAAEKLETNSDLVAGNFYFVGDYEQNFGEWLEKLHTVLGSPVSYLCVKPLLIAARPLMRFANWVAGGRLNALAFQIGFEAFWIFILSGVTCDTSKAQKDLEWVPYTAEEGFQRLQQHVIEREEKMNMKLNHASGKVKTL